MAKVRADPKVVAGVGFVARARAREGVISTRAEVCGVGVGRTPG